jgi:membrane protease YdiL (CAAX protease family)
VALYLALTIAFCIPSYVLIARYGLQGGNGGYVTLLMWGPACAAIATTALLGLGWRPLGFVWRAPRLSLASYLLPLGYAGAAYIVIWLAGFGAAPGAQQIAPLAAKLGWTIDDPYMFVPLYTLFAGSTLIFAGVARGLGEELGWRGFLGPILHERFGFTAGALLTGLIWASWHVPLIIFSDYNNGTPAWFAFGCFLVLVLNLSVIMAWFRLRSDSVWPAAILHGSHNLFVQAVFTPLTGTRGGITAYAIDEFGFMLPLTTFIVALVFWHRRHDPRQRWNADKEKVPDLT